MARCGSLLIVVLLSIAFTSPAVHAQRSGAPQGGHAHASARAEMDRDLLEVTIPRLEEFYGSHKYTVTQVVQWYLGRITKYNGIYRAVENVNTAGALQTAAREDADAKAGGAGFKHGPMWGVPIVIKANTSIEGLVTSDGWKGFKISGHELVAPRDATIVAKLKASGAVILGQTNMPDFAASDTNRSTSFGRTGNAYDVRFSPGGSSGGTVTAVTSNFALLGNGTDTGNSIRMPSSTSSVVGVLPTRGLTSTAGIAPLDWLLDNTGPIARDVADAAIALSVMAGEDPLDPQTAGSAAKAQPGPYTQYLKSDALKGKRFGVPAFIMHGTGVPWEDISAPLPDTPASLDAWRLPLQPETRDAFMKAIEGLRAAGATVVFDESILPDSFAEAVGNVHTLPYIREGTEVFLKTFGPAQYHSPAEYAKAVGVPLPVILIGGAVPDGDHKGGAPIVQRTIESDPAAETNFYAPRRRALAAYTEVFDRLHLDGLVYPAAQMPPPDETMAQDGRLSEGPAQHHCLGECNRNSGRGRARRILRGWFALRPGTFR